MTLFVAVHLALAEFQVPGALLVLSVEDGSGRSVEESGRRQGRAKYRIDTRAGASVQEP